MDDPPNGYPVRHRRVYQTPGRMLIQCQACNTKYRLNLEQIPRRKTFVRCKSCGTPIYIDPTEEEEPQAGVIPPPEGSTEEPNAEPPEAGPGDVPPPEAAAGEEARPEPEAEQVSVVCPNCAARYRIAAAAVLRPGVKLKCSQCGHLFGLSQALGETSAPPAEPPAGPAASGAPTMPPPPATPERPREMPLPDEAHMDQLFDDLRPEAQPVPATPEVESDSDLGTLESTDFQDEPPAPDAEQAYLDSVTFDEERSGKPQSGTVPDDQKFRFFLNPKSYQGRDRGMADNPDEKAPEMAPEEPETEIGPGEPGELPAAAEEPELPPLPSLHVIQSREEMAKVREVVPGPEVGGLSEKRVLAIVAVAAVLVLAGAGLWGYWLASTAGTQRAFQVQMGQPHQLVMDTGVQGHYVTNAPTGTRLFVVSGKVQNGFASKDRIRWIRIKGVAYADKTQSQSLGTAYAYAGNVLTDTQLKQWELPAVKAYYGFTNGRPDHDGGEDLNVSIAPGATVPYQLVFTQLGNKDVGRTLAEVVSYFRNDHAVFVDNP